MLRQGIDVRWAIAAALLLALPLLWPAIPPLIDLPGHIGSYRIALDGATSPILGRYYGYVWGLIGNLGVELPVMALAPLLGLEPAVKLIVILIPVVTGAGFLWIAYEAHGRVPVTALPALPFAYAYPFHYGFVNYCLGLALAAPAFALWLRLERQERFALRAALFALIAPAVWLAHAVAWMMFALLCQTAELRRQMGRRRIDWAGLASCLPLAIPMVILILVPTGGARGMSGQFSVKDIVKWIVALNRDRWLLLDLASTAFVLAMIGAATLRLGGLRMAPRLTLPALALFALYLVAPQGIGDSFFIQARIVPYAAAFALLAIDPAGLGPALGRSVTIASIAFFAVRTLGTTASLFLYDRTYRTDLAALDHLPDGAAIAVFAPEKCEGGGFAEWTNARVQHLGGIALARRQAFVNDQWALKGLQQVQIRYTQAAPFAAEPSEVVTLTPCTRPGVTYLPDALAKLPRPAFDYVWLLDVAPADQPRRDWLTPVWQAPRAVLYRVVKN